MNQETNTDTRAVPCEGEGERARSVECADTLPALFRSEGFYEDLVPDTAPDPVPPPAFARAAEIGSRLLGLMPVHALGLRRA